MNVKVCKRNSVHLTDHLESGHFVISMAVFSTKKYRKEKKSLIFQNE